MRRLVAGVGAQPHDAQLRPLAAQPLQQHGGGVPAAVVDGQHLVAVAEPVQHRPQPLDEQRQHVLLVVHGDDDGQLGAS